MNILGECAACKAKDAIIEFLQGQVASQAKTIAELASPLVHARIAAAERPPRDRKDSQPANRSSAQMLRMRYADRPEERASEQPTPDQVEASFARK